MWELCSSRCYRNGVLTPFVGGSFGRKYFKGDLTTLHILKAVKAVMIKLCIFIPQNIRNLLGMQSIYGCQYILADVSIFLEPVFRFVNVATSFEKFLNVRIYIFWISKCQCLNKKGIWIFKSSTILKTSIEILSVLYVWKIFFCNIISPVKSKVTMATGMTVDFIVGEIYLKFFWS